VEVERDKVLKEVHVKIVYESSEGIACPVCGEEGKLHDHRKRTLRHLDTCDYKTMLDIEVPRIKCAEHKLQQISVPFAESASRYTHYFEMAVISWLQDDTIKSVAKHFRLGWDAVDGIIGRAVKRGMSRRKKSRPEAIGIDETSSQKGHKYVTVILNKDNDTVIDVIAGRKSESVSKWFKEQETSDFSGVKSVSMDMSDGFIKAIKENIKDAENKICFDRFHVSQHFNKAVNNVRVKEYKDIEAGYKDIPAKERPKNPLLKTRFSFLSNSNRTDNRESKRRAFLSITRLHLRTARAWQIKETASTLWDYAYTGVAEKNWKKLLGWINRCRIDEIKKVGKTIKNYFWGILNAIRLQVTNSMLEAKNSRIQHIKRMACGFRNTERFKRAILFHLGGLNMEFAVT
jgi:transposase